MRLVTASVILFATFQSPTASPLPFAASIVVPGGELSEGIGTGDFDGDKDLDIFLVRGNHKALRDVLLTNDGRGVFTAQSLAAEDIGYGGAVADFNRDGYMDVAVGNDRPNEKVIYFGQRGGPVRLAGTVGIASWTTRNPAAGDLNGDGWPDLVMPNRGGPNWVCFNDGAGRFPLPCQELSSESVSLAAIADMNGDKVLDIVMPNRDGGASYIYLNDGRGKFPTRVPVGSGKDQFRVAAAGDLNGDGHGDVVAGDMTEGATFMYLSSGPGTFAPPLHFGAPRPSPGAPRLPSGRLTNPGDIQYSVAVADLDGDGKLDVVSGHGITAPIVLRNLGKGEFALQRLESSHDPNAYAIAVGDMNGDGALDIVTTGVNTLIYFQRKGR